MPSSKLLYKEISCTPLRRQVSDRAGIMNGLRKLLLLTCLGQIALGSDIIDGEKAPENSLLFMVSVQNVFGHACGGFLITEDFVVTAAHCDDFYRTTHVVLGTHNLKTNPKKIIIEKKFKHPSYQDVGHGNDIMLLKQLHNNANSMLANTLKQNRPQNKQDIFLSKVYKKPREESLGFTETMALSFFLVLFFVTTGADGAHIVGGRDAAPNSRPYMASLQVQGRHICGGALVGESFVVTAAHCEVPIPYTVVLGVNSLIGNESTKQEFTSARVIPHPQYDGHRNDIMLIQLNTKAVLNNAVQLITLKADRLRAASQCLTAGWGDIGDNNTLPLRLQEVNVTTLSAQACRRRWGQVPITRAMVCGVGGRAIQGFCSGDSGGPLVCDGAAAGVVSFSGRRCGDPRTPDVYTRISSFREWITDVIRNSEASQIE
ncbi:serine protease 57 [Stegastes partitus]|uniref:trypsin n=2 Tax=Stegastes partitus TaxID=144197 RepID=A0A9Y4TZH9_9TELE|nr:PREDICTED: serine protease 57 [Stegastes partitus]